MVRRTYVTAIPRIYGCLTLPSVFGRMAIILLVQSTPSASFQFSNRKPRSYFHTDRLIRYCSSTSTDNPTNVAEDWIRDFSISLASPNDDGILNMFTSEQPFWRDMVAFTWNIITMEGRDSIQRFLCQYSGTKSSWYLDETKDIVVTTTNKERQEQQIEFWAKFELDIGTGRAHIRLCQMNDMTWKAHTLLTVLSNLKQLPFQVAPNNRPWGTKHGPVSKRQYWHEKIQHQIIQDETYVAIIGGGQGGLALGARLDRLGVPYIIYEAGSTPGSSWKNRYPSLCLHDPVYYNHMPYLPFPKTWPIFAPRDKIATWMEFYAKALDLNVQTHTKVISAKQQKENDNDSKSWSLNIQHRDSISNKISQSTVRAKHIVFATGNSSHPRIPKFPGQFKGIQLHSSDYKGGKAFKDQKDLRHAVVIGSNNSAFDIVQDLWEQLGDTLTSITMIQRTPSMIVSTESVLKHGLGPLYSENARLHYEEADLVGTTVPYKLALEKWKRVTKLMQQTDAKLLKDVEKAGYQLESGPDGTGIFAKSASEGGGFYINVGCCELMTQGNVSVRYATVERLEEDAIVITDKKTGKDEKIPADLIVYATGFATMDCWVAEICGNDIAKRVGKTWGLGFGHKPTKDPIPWEGELRNMWKPTNVNGLWFQGGNLAQSRHYSRYLALQLAVRYIGYEPNVYGIPKPTPPTDNILS